MFRKKTDIFSWLDYGDYRKRIRNGHSVSSISADTGIPRSLVSDWKRSHTTTTGTPDKTPRILKRTEGPKNNNLLQTQTYTKKATKLKHTCAPLSYNDLLPCSQAKQSRIDEAGLGLSDEQQRLNTQWLKSQRTGKGIKTIQSNCDTICTYIKNQSSKILDVWPAYDSREKKSIKFVVTTEEDTDLKEMKLEYATVVRSVRQYSHEAVVVMETEKDGKCKPSDEDSEKIKEAINKHSRKLMQNHRYLSVITGSGIRSKGFESGKHQLIREACIVMYVQAKGKIPLDEKELPTSLDGIAVDVREGEFQTCASAIEYQEPLRMGCQIKCGAKIGTLGCFLHHPHYGLCAITCAHVVLNDIELHKLRRESKKVWLTEGRYVYQPDRRNEMRNNFGQVKETIYKSGGRNTSGVDLAVVQIEKRPPDSGYFPDSNVPNYEMKYDSGRICSSANENYNWVTKFGAKTGKTEGYIMFSDAVVKQIDHDHRYKVVGRDYTYTLHNQYEVTSSRINVPFNERGDSGAPVFKKDSYGELLCLGMVVGAILPHGHGVVTPVSSIMSELGVLEFMNFKLGRLDRIESQQDRMDNRLVNIVGQQGRMENRLANIEGMQNRMEHHLSNIGSQQNRMRLILERLENHRRR